MRIGAGFFNAAIKYAEEGFVVSERMASSIANDAERLGRFGPTADYFVPSGSPLAAGMDWRHMGEMLSASDGVYTELKNLCVWAKTNAGMGTFYRSQHELVFVFKNGVGKHINNFGLGEQGRHRSNLWTYAGANTFRAGRMEDLKAHPTVKPIDMIANAILDCSKRGGLVVDGFAGSGATLIAAARSGRVGAGIEIDPSYVDLIVKKLEKETGEVAIHGDLFDSFEEVKNMRLVSVE